MRGVESAGMGVKVEGGVSAGGVGVGGRGGVLVGGFLNLNRWNSWEGVGDGRDISDGSLVTWGGKQGGDGGDFTEN